jgi:hypothetical protein
MTTQVIYVIVFILHPPAQPGGFYVLWGILFIFVLTGGRGRGGMPHRSVCAARFAVATGVVPSEGIYSGGRDVMARPVMVSEMMLFSLMGVTAGVVRMSRLIGAANRASPVCTSPARIP